MQTSSADQVRFGDPMSHLVKQRGAAPPPPVIPDAMAKQMKKSGFVVPQARHSSLQCNIISHSALVFCKLSLFWKTATSVQRGVP